MKNISARILLVISTFAFYITTNAQRVSLVLNYNPSVPMGSSFKDYVGNTSFRGFQGAVLYKLNNQVRLGLQTTWNDFYQKYPRQVYKAASGEDISAVLSNTLQYTPIVVKGEYSFLKQGNIKPYVGLGAGVGIINFNQYYGELLYSQAYVKAAFTGDIGVVIPITQNGAGARISTSYNMSPFNKEGIKSINTWNIQAGIYFPFK